MLRGLRRLLGLCAVASMFGACSANGGASSVASGERAAEYYTCRYENPFSHVAECREYRGKAFDAAQAKQACEKPFTGVRGRLSRAACPVKGAIGSCTEDNGGARMAVTFMYGGFRTLYKGACEGFARGVWSDDGKVSAPRVPHGLMDEARAALSSDARVLVSPDALDDRGLDELIRMRQALWFAPRAQGTGTGLMIYPGAAVDPRAYAPLAHAIAGEGYVVGIIPMPGLLALNGIDRAGDAMDERKDVTRWVLSGHSLGGAMAARFVAHDAASSRMAGLVLLAAFPDVSDDLHASTLDVLSIHGSQDGRTTVEEVQAARGLLPKGTRYVLLRGANHAQFGWYGAQEGDRAADIDREAQADLTIASLVHFLRSRATPSTPDPRFASAAARDHNLCHDAQLQLAHVQGLTADHVVSDDIPGLRAFGAAKSRIDVGAPTPIHNVEHRREHGQLSLWSAPPILPSELWCKLKSQDAIVAALHLTPTGPEASCGELNQHTLDWALAQLSPRERDALAPAHKLSTEPDQAFETGVAWLTEGRVVVTTEQASRPRGVRAASLRVAADAEVAEPFRGVHYCKLLASSEALRLLLTP